MLPKCQHVLYVVTSQISKTARLIGQRPCLMSSIVGAGCSTSDYSCQCAHTDSIRANLPKCLKNGQCTPQDVESKHLLPNFLWRYHNTHVSYYHTLDGRSKRTNFVRYFRSNYSARHAQQVSLGPNSSFNQTIIWI